MPITTEARDAIKVIREGLSDEEFIDAMWFRRQAEHPCERVSTGLYPIQLNHTAPNSVANITEFRERARAARQQGGNAA